MPKQKTRKAVAKRFRVTKTGSVLKRYGGQDHFNARNPGKITRKKRNDTVLSPSFHKTVKVLTNQL
ncbi:50S ribosomal protein L35 [Candidatus Uhrbacteria bacterium]|nr:50S ribosomal protein L35 [Candidatus Uhrbacteria bacterium]